MRAALRRFCSLVFVLVTLSLLVSNAFALCTRSAPNLQVIPLQSAGGAAGRVETYQIQVTSADSAECAPSTFFLTGVPPDSSWSVVFLVNSFGLGPGQSSSTSVQVTSPLGLADGGYPVRIRAFNYPNFSLESFVDVQYVVAPTPKPDFSISANPGSLTIHQGLTGSTTVSTTPILGFSSSVSLSASGLPLGMTANFNPAVISGNATSNAVFNVANSVAPGTYNITVTGTSGTLVHSTGVSIKVDVPPQLSTITVSPTNPSLGLGATIQFHATGKYQDNSTQDITNNVIWSSSDTTVADVASGGLGTGKTAGTSTITATFGTISGTTLLTVKNSTGCAHANPSIDVNPTQTPQGKAGRLESFTVTLTNNDSFDCPAAKFLIYGTAPIDPNTSAPEVGWVISFQSTSFNLAPGESGSTQLQVTSPANEPDGVYDVTVNGVNWPVYTNAANAKVQYLVNAVPSDFAISTSPTALTVPRATDGSITVTSTLTGNFNSAVDLSVSGLPSGVTASFDNSTIPAPGAGSATLKFTAAANALIGTTTVTVTGKAGSATRSAQVSLTVSGTAATLTSISVTPANLTLVVGNTQQYRATATYSDSSTQDITSQATWSSSQAAFASIDASGKLTALSAGTTSIMATLQNVTGSTGLTVTATSPVCQPTSPGVDVSPLSSGSGAAGRLVRYQVTITSRDNAPCGVEGAHNFLLSATAPTGWTAVFVSSWFQLLPGESATTEMQVTSPAGTPDGNYDIVVTGLNYHVFRSNSATATYVIGTSSAPDLSISASPSAVSVKQGNSASVGIISQAIGTFNSSVALSATGLPSGVTATFTPASIVAPGSGNSTLNFTAAANASVGTFTVVVSGIGGSLTRTANVTLTVTSTSTATLNQIDLTPATPSIMEGNNQAFHATGTYSDNSTQDITNQVSWSSSDQTVATIDSSGLASALKAGTTTIGAALGLVNGSTLLTVTPHVTGCVRSNPQVVVTPTQASGPAGRTETYTVEVKNLDSTDCAASKFLVSATPVAPSPANGWTITSQLPSVTLAPGETGTDTLMITSPANLDNGTWPLSVAVANWPIYTYASTATIQYITAPDFALSVSPGTVSVNQGSSTSVTVSMLSSGGFNGAVQLSVSGFGTGSSGSFNPATISSGTSTLTLSASGSAAPGTYNLVISGVSGSTTHTVPLSLTVKVVVPVLQSITVTPANFSATIGNAIQYRATGNYSNSSTQDLTNLATWASSSTAVASVNATGLVNALTAGTSTISATYSAIKGSTGLTVNSPGGGGGGGGCTLANPSVTITPATSAPGPAGRLERFTITVRNMDSSACSAATYLLTTNNTPPPPGFSAILTSLQMVLLPGQQQTATLQVISPSTATTGNYVVTVTVLNNPSFSYRTNATATYVVQ